MTRRISVDHAFSLATTCGPAAWVGERSPRHRWHTNTFTWVGRESERVVWRKVRQPEFGVLEIEGTASPDIDAVWLRDVLGVEDAMPTFTDPSIAALAQRFPGLRSMNDGGLYEGLLGAIIGQSVSVAAAAVTQAKLCRLFGDSFTLDDREFWPFPTAEQLADAPVALVRESGVTWKRGEAIVNAAQVVAANQMPTDDWAREHPDETVTRLLELPGVGRWTAESTVLWGLGAVNAHPTNDVALLRAARGVFALPEMTLRELDVLAENWRPARGLAARLLWTNLLGEAPTTPE